MAQSTFVRSTALTGLRALGLQGQQAADAHAQLAAVIESRLGTDLADLLARPERRQDGRIDWFSRRPGPVLAIQELDPAEQRALETEIAARLGRIQALAEELAAGSSASARNLGALLRSATVLPARECIHKVGGHPVLVLWGFASDAGVPPFVPVMRTLPAARAAPQAAPLQPAVASLAAAPGWRDWWRWLLLALLLLLVLVLMLRACQRLPRLAVEAPPAAVGEIDPRQRALEAELARLEAEKQARQAACIARQDLPAEPPAAEPRPAQQAAAPPEEPQSEPVPELPEMPELPKMAAVPKTAPPPQPAEPSCSAPRSPAEAPEVVVVVDSSGSMKEPIAGAPNRLEAAKRAIDDLIDELPPDVDIGLVEFGDCEKVRRDRFYAGSERGQLKAQIERLSPDRGTPLARSIERAGAVMSSQVPGTIVVVTDGEDSCDGDPCAAARALARKKPNIAVNVIDIGSEAGSAASCIASATGGKVYKPDSSLDFKRMVHEAGGEAAVEPCG